MEFRQTLPGVALHRQQTARATSDEALVGLIANGDRDAMRVLFARHNVRVFRFTMRFMNNEASAEDAVNEVFLEVWRSAGTFEARSKAATWILSIARHKALSSLRRRSFDELDEGMAERIEDPSDDPEAMMQNSDRSEALRACLAQLSPAHREVIDLIYYHEQSIDEVARIVGVPANTVKTRAFHARQRIAAMMAARGLERAAL
ncbi:MAG TPA: sigma-70 family RNA polymerase sigma factor [Xanthobacteraceae bacterium]|jgi:RNA polymerase sigma-70 factor (ECF subfamily)|nr:sigma-70 family RNA polymerase sigma factor [Xanthobacteraceae bacterium]